LSDCLDPEEQGNHFL